MDKIIKATSDICQPIHVETHTEIDISTSDLDCSIKFSRVVDKKEMIEVLEHTLFFLKDGG